MMNWRFKLSGKSGVHSGATTLACVLFLYTANAQRNAQSDMVRLPAQALIEFAATSTLHDFGGQLPAQPFFLVLSNRTWSAEADVLSALMITDNDKRDARMHEMFNTNTFPNIHGRVEAAPVPLLFTTNVTLTLKIRDREENLPVVITGWQETDSEIRFHAEWEVSRKQFGLITPTVLGVIRVGDRVQLKADVIALKNSSPTNPPVLKQ